MPLVFVRYYLFHEADFGNPRGVNSPAFDIWGGGFENGWRIRKREKVKAKEQKKRQKAIQELT